MEKDKKNSYKNNKFEISAPTQNEELELLDNRSLRIYVNKI